MGISLHNLSRVATLLVLCSWVLTAQGTQTASMRGEVIDPRGAALDNVTILLRSPSMQGTRVVTTDVKGRFIARLLPPGVYTISLEKEGYTTVKHTEKVGLDQNFQPRFVMGTTAGIIIEIVAAPPSLDKTDIKTSSNFSNETIDLLPNGRSMTSVALLTPGVVAGIGGRLQIRGSMTSGNLMLVDGQNIQDNVFTYAGIKPIDDAMEETQIITGAISAEYGNVDGGVINSISKSGSNEFHGQLRFDLSNAHWNALKPYQRSSDITDDLNRSQAFTLGGFAIKDKFWFHVGMYTKKNSVPQNIDTRAISGGGIQGYTYSIAEIRRQAKLTWLMSPEHTLVYSWMNSSNNETNRNYGAGELAALIPQKYADDLQSLAWRALWGSWMTTDLRFGQKKQLYTPGATGNQSPIMDMRYNNLTFNNGIFNANDGGDKRENQTLNLKASLFWDGVGSHQTDVGIDWYEGLRSARNDLSPTSKAFYVNDINLTTRQAYLSSNPINPSYVIQCTTAPGKAIQDATGFYLNDKWSLNKQLSLQIGLRYDTYVAKDESGTQTAGASGLSPRLGLKYDVEGDARWILGASYARYNAQVLEAITNQVTNQGNPIKAQYLFTGGSGWYNFQDVQNITYSSSLGTYSNPKVNVRLKKDLKPQSVDELQASIAHTFHNPTVGEGFLSLTYVYKNWNDLIDYSIGNNGKVTYDATHEFYLRVWDNTSDAKRKYQGLELVSETKKGSFMLGGNITWSQLKGNYEGERSFAAGTGEGLHAWTVVNGVPMFDSSINHPYGYLAGDAPLRMRIMGSYAVASDIGTTTVGMVYRYDAGSRYSDTRGITRLGLNPLIPSEAGNSFAQYRYGTRGMAGQFPSASSLDLAITHDWPMFKISDTPVRAFLKLTSSNVFNHQKQIAWDTKSESAFAPGDPWQYASTYGTTGSPDYYAGARSILISCGVRF